MDQGLPRQWRYSVRGDGDVIEGSGVAAGGFGAPDRERDPKKSGGVLRQRVPVRYAWIEDHRDSWPVIRMCSALRVSRSGYYDWRSRKPSERALRRRRI